VALARVHLREHTDRALDDAEAALARAAAADATALVANRTKLAAMVAARRGDARAALERFESAYAAAEGNPGLRARVLLAWAVQLRNWGLFDEARRKVERSLEVRLELGDHYGAALCWGTLAFIHQRMGDHARERDALAADLREVERIGGAADLPALRGRMAGALVGLGKYAGAWAEAEAAIASENARLGLTEVDDASATRTHGYAWREMARVCLAQSRREEGAVLAERAAATFDRLHDGYGAALCRLTLAELEVGRAEADDGDAADRARAALAIARPVFVRLGALPEAAEAVLLGARLDALTGDATAAAARIVDRVLPGLEQAGLGHTELARRAAELAVALDPGAGHERVVRRAARLKSLAAAMVEDEVG
jgi:tetratricopeptide (TPR) repeat protein